MYELLKGAAWVGFMVALAGALLKLSPRVVGANRWSGTVSTWLLAAGLPTLALSLPALSVLNETNKRSARESLMRRLEGVGAEPTVMVGATRVEGADRIVAALRGVSEAGGHHSFPKSPVVVEIRGKVSSVQVIGAQDSQRATEFWIYVPGYGIPDGRAGGQRIGRITSPELLQGWPKSDQDRVRR